MSVPMPGRFSWSVVAAVFLLGGAAAQAVPLEQKVGFPGEALPTEHWEVRAGNKAAVVVRDGRLVLRSTPGRGAEAVYTYYARRSEEARPAFGPFEAEAVVDDAAGVAVRFGLEGPGGWRLWLECDPAAGTATVGGGTGQEKKQAPLVLAGPGRVKLRWVADGGKVTAVVEDQAGAHPIAAWQGEIPEIVSFFIERPAGSEEASVAVESLRISPLAPREGMAEVLPRPGTPLSPDAGIPREILPQVGGEARGGYLWSRDEKALLPVRVSNIMEREAAFRLVQTVRDTGNAVVAEREERVVVGAGQDRVVETPLYQDRYGFYTVETRLLDEAGRVLGAPLYTDYGITAALPPGELSAENPVGTHGYPFANLGVKWVRYWDNGGGMFWSGIEREKGRWDWSAADAYVSRTLAAGMRPLMVLGMTPEWASSDPSYGTYVGRGAFSPASHLEDWAVYCREAARRYKGRVDHFEIWNEPNNNALGDEGFFFKGNVKQYLEVLQVAYRAVKEGNPDAVVLAPSATGHFFPFLRRLMELGGGDFFDVLSIHTYTTPFPPEIGYQFNGEKSYEERVARARAILREFGKEKPIWNTEVGFSYAPTVAGRRMNAQDVADEALPGIWPNWSSSWAFRPLDERRAAAFAVRFFLLSEALHIEKTFYHHRLMERADGRPYVLAPAVGWLSRLIDGAEYDREYDWGGQVKALGFRLKGGRYMVACWRIERETLAMNAEADAKVGQVDSAPLVGAAGQRSLGAVAGAGNTGRPYFAPGEACPVAVRFGEPVGGYDFWGNAVKAARRWDLGEEPRYLVFADRPDALAAVVERGEPARLPSAVTPFAATGRWVAAGTVARMDSPSVKSVFPGAIPLALTAGRSEAGGRVASASEVVLGTFHLPMPGLPPGRGRLLLEVRSNDKPSPDYSYTYGILGGDTLERLRPWPVIPIVEAMRGDGWSLMRGAMISASLPAPTELTLACDRSEGRIFSAWWIPDTQPHTAP